MGNRISGQKGRPKKTKLQESIPESFHYQKGTCALEYWEPIKLLGEGSISSIHLVRRRKERIDVPYKERVDIMSLAAATAADAQDDVVDETDVYALKSIMKNHVRNDRLLEEMRREIFTMSHLDHPNIVHVYEAYERKRHIYLILEYCSGGDLVDRRFSVKDSAIVVRDILRAVQYMHQHKVVHRDLKLENIMLNASNEIKIIDFGLATKYLTDDYRKMTDRVGTLYSMAPQVLQGVYTAQCDLWSIGVVTYLLLSGKQPFWGPPRQMPWPQRRKIMVDRIIRCQYMRMNGPSWDAVPEIAKNFVASLLQMDPDDRPTATKALEHPWIRSVGDTSLVVVAELEQQRQVIASLKRRARQQCATQLSEAEITELRDTLTSYDATGDGQVPLADLRRALQKQTSLSTNEITSIFDSVDLTISQIDYMSFIVQVLESKGRTESERIADSLAQLDVGGKGKLPIGTLQTVMEKNVSERIMSGILDQLDQDADGFVATEQVMDLLGRAQARQVSDSIGASSSFDIDNEEDEAYDEFADEFNTIIPGGRNATGSIPKYIFDAKEKSFRKISK